MNIEEIKIAFEKLQRLSKGTNKDTIKSINEYYDDITNYDNDSYQFTCPGEFSNNVLKVKSEIGYQRELINSKESEINGEIVSWCDIEIPIKYGKTPRRHCLDLIGHVNGDKIVICELKYANRNKKNSCNPLKAGAQILYYYFYILKNIENFKVNSVFHKNSINPKKIKWDNAQNNIVIIVAANELYWDKYLTGRWFREKTKNNSNSRKNIIAIFKEIGIDFYITSKNVDNTFMWVKIT